jgi:hypothetical protein
MRSPVRRAVPQVLHESTCTHTERCRLRMESFMSQKLKFVPFRMEHLHTRDFRMHQRHSCIEDLLIQNADAIAFNQRRAVPFNHDTDDLSAEFGNTVLPFV